MLPKASKATVSWARSPSAAGRCPLTCEEEEEAPDWLANSPKGSANVWLRRLTSPRVVLTCCSLTTTCACRVLTQTNRIGHAHGEPRGCRGASLVRPLPEPLPCLRCRQAISAVPCTLAHWANIITKLNSTNTRHLYYRRSTTTTSWPCHSKRLPMSHQTIHHAAPPRCRN